MSFASVIAPKPTLACVGQIISVGEPAETKQKFYDAEGTLAKPRYIMHKLTINGSDAQPFPTNIWWMYRPEWLRKGFRPDVFKAYNTEDAPIGDTLLAVYNNQIAQNPENKFGNVSVLQGLCGVRLYKEQFKDTELFDEVADHIFNLPGITLSDGTEGVDPNGVKGVIESLLKGREIGYVLKQDSEKTDSINPETGKPIYALKKYYKIGEWFSPTNEYAVKSLAKRAEKYDNFLVTFEGADGLGNVISDDVAF